MKKLKLVQTIVKQKKKREREESKFGYAYAHRSHKSAYSPVRRRQPFLDCSNTCLQLELKQSFADKEEDAMEVHINPRQKKN